MTRELVENAKVKALRFVRKADEALILQGYKGKIETGKDAATLRRASLDLTRILAEMRKP